MKKLLSTLKKLKLKTILYVDTTGVIPDSLFELIRTSIPNILIIVISTTIRYKEKNKNYIHIYRPVLSLDVLVEIDLFMGSKVFIDDINIKNYKYALFLANYSDIEFPKRKYFYFPNEMVIHLPLFLQNILVQLKIFQDKDVKYELIKCETL